MGQQQIRMQQMQMQQQQQQQGFRMQQNATTRPPLNPTQLSGEPIRPNFPPQQPVAGTANDAMRHMRPVGPMSQPSSFPGAPQPNSIMTQRPAIMSQMAPPIRGSLRLSIPPQQQLIPGSQIRTPGTPGAFGSQQQPSPSLTPRSEDGDSCGSSRGTTPAP